MKYILQFRPKDIFELMSNGRKPQIRTDVSLKGKLAVISGATNGIGLTTAKRLAAAGCNLIIIARNPALAKEVSAGIAQQFGVNVDSIIADYSDLSQVNRAAENLLQREEPVDILINNAGVHSTTRKITPAGIEMVFCVDHLAHFLLTFRLIPKLKQQKKARIIDVNSEGHRFYRVRPNDINFDRHHYTGLRGYGAAKTAQLLTVWEFADQLAGTGITINALHPGAVHSNVGTNNGPLYRWFYRNILGRMFKENSVSAEAIYALAAAPEFEGISGKFFNLTREERPAPHALDRKLGRIVWEKSMELTGLRNEQEN